MSSAKTIPQTRSRSNSRNAIEQNGGNINMDRQVTPAAVTSSGLGPRQMTLYLSRTTSMMKPGSDKKNQADENEGEKRDSLTNGHILPQTSFQREFTFTGYDIMADNEPIEPDKVDDEEREKRRNVQSYLSACHHLGHTPISYVSKHINDPYFSMKCHPLGSEGTRALCIALVSNKRVTSLNLENDDVGPDGAVHVTDMLKENDTITQVHIGENLIGTRGIYALSTLLKEGKQLHTLDVSGSINDPVKVERFQKFQTGHSENLSLQDQLLGSNLEDSDAKYIAEIMETNPHLKVLKVGHNRIGDLGGFDLGRAIAINETLAELDLSWNHLRGKGALAVAIGVKRNVGLRKLNLSWNGFGQAGCLALGQALKENRTLRELDIASNRLTVEAVGGLMKGLQENDGLHIIRMGQNPLSPEVALTILKSVEQSDKCILHTLDLRDVVVTDDFIKLMEEIKKSKDLTVIFGATVKGTEAPRTDPNAIDWRDPVVRMFKFMQEAGYRVIDLMKRFDKDRSLSVDRQEFKLGLMSENIPLTEDQLDDIVDRLDIDGDGEVDLGELIAGEKDFRRKMHIRMRKQLKGHDRVDETLAKLMKIEEL